MAKYDKTETSVDKEVPLGGFVPEEVYWDFKEAAARRQEKIKEALTHAALLYIAVDTDEEANDYARQR